MESLEGKTATESAEEEKICKEKMSSWILANCESIQRSDALIYADMFYSNKLKSILRVARKLKDDAKFFVGGASAADIQQGRFGTCYFLAALAALAEEAPEKLQALQASVKGMGAFCIRWYPCPRYWYIFRC
mgnify:CR=1 FL=1